MVLLRPRPLTARTLLAILTAFAPLLGVLAAIVAPPAALVAAAGACTLYAAPGGSATNSGAAPTSPLSLGAAAGRTQPGSVVCLLDGTYAVDTPFQITRAGTAAAWVTYRGYGSGAVLVPRSGAAPLLQVPSGVGYVEVSGLQFDGRNVASTGIGCKGAHHLRIVGNHVRNTGAGGIATYQDSAGHGCDYITVDGNWVSHVGYVQGWSSGISLNSHAKLDSTTGFHSVIVNNIVSGTYDASTHHSDGNGIIVDNQAGMQSPPVLIANNVVYQNGGRCIHSRYAQVVWIVNNTCYKNGLDLAVKGGSLGNNGEYPLYGSSGDVLINNLAVAWGDRRPYSDEAGSTALYRRNVWWTVGTGRNYVPASVTADPLQLRQADPRFVAPPAVNLSAGGQYAGALAPEQVTTHFQLQAGSPAIDAGVDPTTLPGLSSAIVAGLRQYVLRDVTGKARPQGGGFDLGAYEAGAGGAAPPPTATPTAPSPVPTATPGSGGTQSTLLATADGYVDSASPATNFGSANPLASDAAPSVRMTYLKFNLSSLAGKTVTSARLRLAVYDGSSGIHNLRSISDTSWTEMGLTWQNRPALGSIVGRATSPATSSWIDLDVTTLVKSRVGQSIAFALDCSSEDGLLIKSRESAPSSQPQLIVR